MACRQRPAHRPTPLLESALSPLFPSLLKKHTHSHALLPSKKEKPLLFTFYIFYKVIPHYHISNVKEESTMQTLLYGAQIIRRTNRMRSTRKAGSCWRTTGSSASALAPRRRSRRAPSSAAFPVGSSCPASSISTPMWAAPCSRASPRTSKGPSTGWLSPWNALSPGNPCTASVCWGPWRPSNSAPPSSMTCTTSRNPPPARRRSWVCAASSHKRSTTPTCKTCTITIILRCRGRPPKSCRPNRYHCGVLAVRHHPGQYRRLQIRCLDRLFAGHPHGHHRGGHLHRGVQGRRLEFCRCKHPAFRHRPQPRPALQ